mmetsp:Transcript_24800/g.53490  ORF Transcript_24800/g.53490 Transcript_24800/m.53490 type:complete len:400 (-) Transcript_24800:125-1324(-)|eukprot:CAMPEP_0172302826 /NCGR_PEP_ID=MMETSP1058-20130122/4480_1 /TAXON_ID=83371 /ORGANISM="Detonula confervacea, Strain CCMP 353" /LENGTH=399 /DNA_ID=CAMNT_0013013459 /DNA_START=44 /DNA_END=1243 /DNA_ORIENTATION=+
MAVKRILGVAAAASVQTLCWGFQMPPTAPITIRHKSKTMVGSSTKKSIFDSEVEDMFTKYDTDGNGTIDKEEFRAVVKKMKSSSRRREILSVLTATFGSLFVADSSSEFQFAQKRLRSGYLEELAESSQKKLFPTAMLSSDFDDAVAKVLKPRGFTPENTLFGHSVCADEVNNRKEQLVPLMVNRWEEGFALGGLGGLPFAGKSGFGAYLHHVPDDGKLLVLFAPHVGIDDTGTVGALQRDGQAKVSSACGAAVGAYKALQKAKKAKPDPLLVLEAENQREFDPQLKNIVSLLAPRLDGIDESADSIAFLTYQMYGIIRELVNDCIAETPDLFDCADEIAIVGGVMINRRKGGDFFQPLSLETRRKGETIDLFEEAFGDRPNLLPVIGTESAMTRASLY